MSNTTQGLRLISFYIGLTTAALKAEFTTSNVSEEFITWVMKE